MNGYGGGIERYYRVLGLLPGADIREVKAAYRRLAKRLHPDRSPNDPRAVHRFHRVAEAYRAIIGKKEQSQAELFIFLRMARARGNVRDIVRSYRSRAISTLLLSRLALAHIEEGFLDQACDIFTRLRSAGPPLVCTHINLAYLSFLEGDEGRALETLYRARELFGSDPIIDLNIILLLKKAGRFCEAIGEIEEQADDAREKGGFYQDMARAVSFFDDRRRVVRHLRRAVDDRHWEISSVSAKSRAVRYLAAPRTDHPS